MVIIIAARFVVIWLLSRRIWLEKSSVARLFEHEFDAALLRRRLVNELDDFRVKLAIEAIAVRVHFGSYIEGIYLTL